jgi:hypothetical protein
MSDDTPLSIKDFGASFKGFLEQVTREAPPPEDPFFLKKLRQHFGEDPALLPTLSESFATSDHANVQMAMDAYLAGEGRSSELFGMISEHPVYAGMTFSQLIAAPGRGLAYGSGVAQGPVEYVNLPSGDETLLACVKSGLYVISAASPIAVLLRGPDGYMNRNVTIEVMARDKSVAEEFFATIHKNMRVRNIYRGRIVSLSWDEALKIDFHRLRKIDRDSIILPEGLLDRVERHTIGFSRVAGKLRAAARHLKRGLLLHGAPGTGKTLTAMYLAGQSPDRTVILLTGRSLGLIEQSCAMARALQPATVIIEDVDLVAEERTHQNTACNAVLFELLNQMDGLAEDDILEPALASRPGRIDQAIEVPLPDADCRRRLFELYGKGLILAVADLDSFVRRTEGASAAFIRELLRRAALIAAEESDPIRIEDRHVDEALHELVIAGGELTKALLGGKIAGH